MFKNYFEAPEVEVARLATAPVGSKAHTLSTLPVNIRGPVEDLMIELPFAAQSGYTVVVVPFDSYELTAEEKAEKPPIRRYRTWWRCLVIASNHPSYPVGGNRLAIGEDEIVRGTLRTLEVPAAPANADA
ncbi:MULTISPECIES: hypothetical protein [unclassified Microbacterium]|uniref:hypothetical protein n=1 Tax=unclassified Microbacterium TaxID=2609290 RepID=UPI002882E012|nr:MULTISPECIES: hypothetical protein [unclassified Microbacterium]